YGRTRSFGRIASADTADFTSVDRRRADEIAAARIDSQFFQDRGGFLCRAHLKSSLARAIASTPASIVSSRLAKQRRTRCRDGLSSAKADTGTVATPACSTAALANVSSSTSRPDALRSTHRK